jgi:hypothetical protein
MRHIRENGSPALARFRGTVAGNHLLVYGFDGAACPEQPVIKIRACYYWSKLHDYFGRSVESPSVLAMVSTPACRDLPPHKLADLSDGEPAFSSTFRLRT